jgi:hypothetical protein
MKIVKNNNNNNQYKYVCFLAPNRCELGIHECRKDGTRQPDIILAESWNFLENSWKLYSIIILLSLK